MRFMPSLFAVVSAQKFFPSRILNAMMRTTALAGAARTRPARGFVGDEPFSTCLPAPSLPDRPASVAAVQVGEPFLDEKILADPPTRRTDRLADIRAFLLDGIEQEGETQGRSPLFGSALVKWRERLRVARDRLGTEPLFWAPGRITGFSSEIRALRAAGFENSRPFPPALMQDWPVQSSPNLLPTEPFRSERRPRPSLSNLVRALFRAISSIPAPRSVFFSGGIDSLVLAKISEESGETVLITAGLPGSKDLARARSAVRALSSPLEVAEIRVDELEEGVNELIGILPGDGAMNVAIAYPIMRAAAKAHELGVPLALTGQGADELFGGYHRYLSDPEPLPSMNADLVALHRRGLDACTLAARSKGVDILLPYLDDAFVEMATSLPLDAKLRQGQRKVLLRKIGGRLGLPSELLIAKKCAVQYGSGVNKHISSMLRKRFHESGRSRLHR